MLAVAGLAALAGFLLIGPPPRTRMKRAEATQRTRTWQLPAWAPAVGLTSVALALGIGLHVLAWMATLGVTTATIVYLVISHRRRRAARRRAEECAKAARVLSGLLRVGQIPTVALAEAAMDCEVLRPAATASGLGGDVGAELERAAALPGQGGMRAVAAAWRVSQRSGAPMAEVLALVAENLRRQRQLEAVIDTELSAARSSGHIMAALPLLAVGLGAVVGVNTLAYLAADPLGQVLLLVGVCLTAVGVLWIDRLARSGSKECS